MHRPDLGAQPHVRALAAGGILEQDGERRPLHGERDRAVGEGHAERDVAEVATGGAVHPVEPARVADRAGVVEHAQHVERVEAVGGDGHPRALVGVGDRAALEHGRVEPESGGGERDGRPGDASADDE